MKNFMQAMRLTLRHRGNVIGIVICSFMVAVLWGASIGTVYPFVEVLFRGDSMHDWVDKQLEETKQRSAEINARLEHLRKQQADAASAAERKRWDGKIAAAKNALDAEQTARARALWMEPYIKRFLPESPLRTLVVIVMFVLVGTILKDLCVAADMMLVARLGQLTTLALSNQFYRHTLQMELSAFGQERKGDLMSRFTADLSAVSAGIVTLFGKSVREPLKIIVCLIGAAWISWRLLVVSLLISPLALFLMYMLAKSIKRASRRALEEMGQVYNRLAESFAGIKVVKAFTMERLERRRFLQTCKELHRKSMRIALYRSLTRFNNELFGVFVIVLAILAGGYLVLNQETHLLGIKITDRPLSFGSLMVFYGFLIGVSDPARKITDVFSLLQRAAAAADRIYRLLDCEPTITDPEHPVPFPTDQRDLLFENVSFHYLPQQPVLKNVTLRIGAGETLAVVGPNGCGKSTLANLVLRFYDPVEGSIRLDDIDLRQMKRRELRKRIGLVTQQPVLFDDTIANNIRYGSPHASDEQVVEAAKKAHAHAFISEELEHGYQSYVGERGGRLSGGQRQRIALARAILRDPAILILDEATSQIDPESEQLIHHALQQFNRRRMVIVITHRSSALALADRILVMDEGRILDLGTHEELTDRCDLYRRLNQTGWKESA